MKHKTTFEKLLGTNAGRSKNWKTLPSNEAGYLSAIVFMRLFYCLFSNNGERERPLFESLFKENRTSKQLQILLQ